VVATAAVIQADFDLPFGNEIHFVAGVVLVEDHRVGIVNLTVADGSEAGKLAGTEAAAQGHARKNLYEFHLHPPIL